MVDLKRYTERQPEWIEGSGGVKLAATVYRRDPKRWMMGVHGGHSQSKRRGPRWAHLNELAGRYDWSFVAFDLRDEDGDSQPHMDANITQSLQDLDLVVNTLVPEGGQVVPWGHSRGGLLAFLWAATRSSRKVDACVLIAPAFSSYARLLVQLKEQGLNEEEWRRTGTVTYTRRGKMQTRTWEEAQDARMWDIHEKRLAISFEVPTLVIHSRKDTVVPHSLSERFADWCISADVRIVPNGDHQFNGQEHWLMGETERFLMRQNVF